MAIPAGDIDHERENAEDLRHTVGQRAVTGEFGRYTVDYSAPVTCGFMDHRSPAHAVSASMVSPCPPTTQVR